MAFAVKTMGMNSKAQRNVKEKKDWTFWLCIGLVAVFIVAVIGVYFVKKSNALNKTYIKVGEEEVTQLEFDYYYKTVTNNYLTQYSSYLSYFGIDSSIPLDEQTCTYDSNLTWADYFMQSAVPMIQQVKALNAQADADGFEYDATEDYNEYLTNLASTISSAGVSEDYYYTQTFGKYATKARLEPYVKEYLKSQAYYEKLLEDHAATADEIKAAYDENPEQYDTIAYRLYSIVADVEDDAEESEVTAAVNKTELAAKELAERFEAGEDWRELCYEYAKEDAKKNYDPSSETDPTVITGGTSQTISMKYFDWLSDDSRKAGDVMTYKDEDNKESFVVVFDSKTAYDLDSDPSGIGSTLAYDKVNEIVEGLLGSYEVSDPDEHLRYLHVVSEETGNTEDTSDTTETSDTAESEQTSDTADTTETE